MRLILVLCVLVCQLAPASALAGAWLREKGSTFLSTTFTLNYFRETGSSTYYEYGYRDDVTFGLDLSMFNTRIGLQTGAATLFVRRPIGKNEGPNKWAYELGVGTAWIGDLVLPHVKTGLSWGRGIKVRDKYGWLAVDASINWEAKFGQTLSKVDATIGLNFSDTTTGIMQVYITHLNGSTFGTLAPSLVYTPRKGKFKIQFGAESPVENFDNTAIKIGIWREF